MGSWSNRKTSAPHAEDLGAIPSESTLMNSPVVQRQRLLSYKQETMVQLHPGLLTNAQVRQLAERLGLNPRDSRFDSSSGHMRLGRQLADHLGLEPGMLWVRIPPELLAIELRPRGAAWSARLPVTQEIVGSNPIGDARQHGTQTGKAAKLKPS
jgi:hypothetical protein